MRSLGKYAENFNLESVSVCPSCGLAAGEGQDEEGRKKEASKVIQTIGQSNTALACFFLPSFISLTCMYMYVYGCTNTLFHYLLTTLIYSLLHLRPLSFPLSLTHIHVHTHTRTHMLAISPPRTHHAYGTPPIHTYIMNPLIHTIIPPPQPHTYTMHTPHNLHTYCRGPNCCEWRQQ